MKKKPHGGKRPGAGRKPRTDKAVQKTIYISPDVLAKIPGTVGQWIESDPRLK